MHERPASIASISKAIGVPSLKRRKFLDNLSQAFRYADMLRALGFALVTLDACVRFPVTKPFVLGLGEFGKSVNFQ